MDLVIPGIGRYSWGEGGDSSGQILLEKGKYYW